MNYTILKKYKHLDHTQENVSLLLDKGIPVYVPEDFYGEVPYYNTYTIKYNVVILPYIFMRDWSFPEQYPEHI